MRAQDYRWSYLALRIGLGIVFLWIGIDILRHPDAWIGFLPAQLPFSRELALQLNGAFDIAIGLLLFAGWWPKIIAALAALHLLAIIFTQGIDVVLIRDVGLFGASIALLAWPQKS